MSSRELSEWTVFYQMEPFGEIAGDVRAARVSMTVAAAHTPRGKPRPKLRDHMPDHWFDDLARRQSDAELLAVREQFRIAWKVK